MLPAGLDPAEAADLAAAYAGLGATHLVATRLDLARRCGSVLAAAEAGPLALAEAGVGAGAADGLVPLTPRPARQPALRHGRPGYPPRRQERRVTHLAPIPLPASAGPANAPAPGAAGPFIAVASGKGGVGKTWLAVTLAHALARQGRHALPVRRRPWARERRRAARPGPRRTTWARCWPGG